MTTTVPANEVKQRIGGGYQIQVGRADTAVTVTDTDLQVYEVQAGGDFTCTPPPPADPPSKSTKTYTFPQDGALVYEQFVDFDCTVDLAAAVLVNVATVAYLKNGVSASGSISLVQGDSLTITIAKVSGSIDATVAIEFEYATDTEAVTVPDYIYANWTNLLNVSADTTFYQPENHAIQANGGGSAASYTARGAHSVESLSGLFTVEFDQITALTKIGLSLTNAGAVNANNIVYGFWNLWGNDMLRTESGTPLGGFGVVGSQFDTVSLRIVDSGVAIEYWYKYKGGSWTKFMDSAAAYVAGRTYYLYCIFGTDGSRLGGARIYP